MLLQIRKILKKIPFLVKIVTFLRDINRKLKARKMYIYFGDLMQSRNNMVSMVQLIIVSRILDLENYRKGDASFEWTCQKWRLLHTDRKDVSAEEVKQQWLFLVDQLDRYGINPILGRIMVTTNKGRYFLPANGTHRMAWCYTSGIMCVPVEVIEDVAWFSENGVEYCRKYGLPEEYIQELIIKYEEIKERLENKLFCYLDANSRNFDKIISIINQYGRLEEYSLEYYNPATKEYLLSSRRSKKISCRKKMASIKLFNFYPDSQELYFKHKKICSKYVQGIISEINNNVAFKENWGGICESVTESMLVRPCVEYGVYFEKNNH